MNRCLDCDYFQRQDGEPVENPITHQIEFKQSPLGVCMAHPPRIHFGQDRSICVYPNVKETFGCGEWSPNAELRKLYAGQVGHIGAGTSGFGG